MGVIHVLLEQPDVFADAGVADQHGQLLFVSIYGRDTSVQQFFARLHQTAAQGGIDGLTLVDCTAATNPPFKLVVGDPKRLQKISGRLPRAGLLGNLVQAWVYDPVLLKADPATRSAWVFTRAGGDGLVGADAGSGADATADAIVGNQAWCLIQELSPVPLLADWREPVMACVRSRGGLLSTSRVGAVQATRIELPDDFSGWVSAGVRNGTLAVPAFSSSALASTFTSPSLKELS